MSAEERPSRVPAPIPDYELEDGDESLSWTQVRHFLYAPLRRPLFVIVPWALALLASVVALFTLPKQYRSATLILVESEKMPDSFVPRVATQDASRRAENIRPEILSRTRIERVLAETNPYPEIQSKTRAVETMRAAISVQQSGQDGFTLEFVHRDPRKAQEVTNGLATLFINEAVRAREQQVGEAIDFLVGQVASARKELETKDEALRRYKEGRMGRLPEQLQTNLATLQMLQREMQTVEEGLFLAREKVDALARGTTRRAPATGAPTPAVDASDLDTLRDQLADLRSRYTDEHPDVESLRSRIARADARLAAAAAADASQSSEPAAAPPAAVTREQLERSRKEVQKLEERQLDLERRITLVRQRVEDTPRTEQELSNLTRDYNKLGDNYTALLSKQLEAQMAGRLEQRWKGDRFRILDPAHLPEKPDSPRPLPILALGLALGLLAGLGTAAAREALDGTVKDAEQLAKLVACPVVGQVSPMAAKR